MTGVGGISNALPAFKLDFGYEYQGQLLIGAVWNALWGAMTSLGLLIGGIACGYISDWRGRRLALTIGCCLSILGVGIMYAASSPAVLLVAKTVSPPLSAPRDDRRQTLTQAGCLPCRSTASPWASSSPSPPCMLPRYHPNPSGPS